MKTRKAFWLKEFDAERILSRPYFKRFNLPQKSDDEILTSLKAKEDDSIDELEEKVQLVKSLHEQAQNFEKMIVRYFDRKSRMGGVVYIDEITARNEVAGLIQALRKLYYEVEGAIQKRYRKTFTERLKQYRKASGLTQRELGELVQVSPRGMARYISGEREVPVHTLIRLSKLLNVSADELLGLR